MSCYDTEPDEELLIATDGGSMYRVFAADATRSSTLRPATRP